MCKVSNIISIWNILIWLYILCRITRISYRVIKLFIIT
nr:MAG TPA: hypothetical protein [Caudoviricetes sp.]